MSQAATLQDIYSKIADIYDKFCNLSSSPEDETELVTNISLSDTTYTATELSSDVTWKEWTFVEEERN